MAECGVWTIAFKNADGIAADELLHGLDPNMSILDVKRMLAESYPGQPPASAQKIVFAGRLLKDSDTLGLVISPGAHMPVIFHLMISAKHAAQAAQKPTTTCQIPDAAVFASTPAAPLSGAPTPFSPPCTPEQPLSAAAAAAAAAAARAAAAVSQPPPSDHFQPSGAAGSSQQSHQSTEVTPPSPAVRNEFDQAPSTPKGIPASGCGSGVGGNSIGEHSHQLSGLTVEGAKSPLHSLLVGSADAQGGLPPSPEQLAALVQLQQELQQVYYQAYYKAYLDNLTPVASPEVPSAASHDVHESLVTPAQAGSPGGDPAAEGRDAQTDAMPAQTLPPAAPDAQMQLEEAQEHAQPAAGDQVHLLAGARAQVNAANAANPERNVPQREQDGPGQNQKSLVLALKLALVVCVLGQDASRERLMALCLCATAIFLHQTGILRVFGWLQAIVEGLQYMAPDARIYDDFGEYEPPEDDSQDAGNDGGDGAGDEGAVADGRRRGENVREYQGGGEGFTGLLVDISALLVGFFTSLVPRTPPEANGF